MQVKHAWLAQRHGTVIGAALGAEDAQADAAGVALRPVVRRADGTRRRVRLCGCRGVCLLYTSDAADDY
ncbi:hypothetical protein PP725_08670, partial [Ralstonia solanacearum]